jgi:dinuclear metal center YbgI/SA1388 family protein
MQLAELTAYLDEYLGIAEIRDYAGALNGLQVESSGSVLSIAVAVDATLATISEASRVGTDLLIVHHGLFWDGNRPVTGRRYRRLRALFAADMALYSAHLPLDAHPEVGNNVVLGRKLGVELRGEFGEYNGTAIGVWGEIDMRREALAARLDSVLGVRVHMIPGGPERIRRVGIVTGGGGAQIEAARALGLDGFITGEGSHHNYFDAEEGGVNLYLGGHYATETWGVRALGAQLHERFDLPWSFIDRPTGL